MPPASHRYDGEMAESLVGSLLIATPALYDPNFYRTVVLMVEHGPEGSLGLVLNRPTSEPVRDHLEDWADHTADPDVIFFGGPVNNEIAVAVIDTVETERQYVEPVFGTIGLLDLSGPTDGLVTDDRIRIFSGYAGWIGGQLEMELQEGSWFTVPATTDDVFNADPDALWTAVLKRQPAPTAFYARFPVDLSLN